MKKMMALFTLCLWIVFPSTVHSQDDQLCVQSLNAYGIWKWQVDFSKKEYKKRARKLNQFLSRNCDVTALQEIWLNEHWQEIKFPFKTSHMAFNKKSTGVVFLGMKPLHHTLNKNFRLRSPGVGGVVRDLPFVNVGKGFSYGKVYKNDNEIHFINVHLHPGFTAQAKATRASQLIEVASFIVNKEFQNKAIILTGDFNAGVKSIELQFLEDFFGFHGRRNFSDECTFIGLGGLLCQSIDYILYKDGEQTLLNLSKKSLKDMNRHGFITDHKLLSVHLEMTNLAVPMNNDIPMNHVQQYKKLFIKIFEKGGNRYKKDILLLENLIKKALYKRGLK